MTANALTIDVEDYFHVHAFQGIIAPSEWDSYPLRVQRNTLRILELLSKHGARATFFVLGWVAERCPDLVKQIFDGGHEIGCHGYAHRVIYRGDEKNFREDVRRAKRLIEDLTGVRVKSYRAPSYSITSSTLWALEILGEEGFEYDSSVFPVWHDNYGIPGAPRFPYTHELHCGVSLKEFPPSTLRLCGVNVPVAGGGYLRLFPYALTAWAIRRINQVERQPAMVYLHPWELDLDQPRIVAPWRSRFRHYQNLRTTEGKCARLLEEFCWAPMEAILHGNGYGTPAKGEVYNVA
ncbi:MAG: XrtA system polysaccharide deacetylase [Alphaproteobacteria bacterium]